MVAVTCVLYFLKGNPNQGIFFLSSTNTQITAYTDSDWANCPTTHRSTIGNFIQLGNYPISWHTKKQTIVARSSAEGEYHALTYLGISYPEFSILHCDNQFALYITHNLVFYECTKYIEIDCHIIRHKICSGLFKVVHTSFTKTLGHDIFHHFLRKLDIMDFHLPTWEGVLTEDSFHNIDK